MRTDFYVYLWTNTVNGKQYVGKGRNGRGPSHAKRAERGEKGCPVLYASMRKYGTDKFVFSYLEQGLSDEEAQLREKHYISTRGTKVPNGYNVTDGGDGHAGHFPDDALRARLSELAKNRSQEHIQKIWATRRANGTDKAKPETLEKLSKASKGRVVSDETRAKKRTKMQGLKRSPEEALKRIETLKSKGLPLGGTRESALKAWETRRRKKAEAQGV